MRRRRLLIADSRSNSWRDTASPMGYSVETTGQKSACQRRCVFSIIVWIIIIVVVLALLGFFARSRR